ncbi:uncharacterized protein LOC5511177 isoform X2 [Nematostella vectensis]|uniref:uncharacterized protein LOC5511177 isoform X2 n=1 Tax=Nematostella vectensis TaxID=45351 RepID=UPI002076EE19|nr:uncharacterized protein LOC5511177 isoform X2 [Nematostella vectensis]
MSSRANDFVGSKIQVQTAEDSYEGIVHSIDEKKKQLTLSQVVLCSSGKRLHGCMNFFGHELDNLFILETAEAMRVKDSVRNPEEHDTQSNAEVSQENGSSKFSQANSAETCHSRTTKPVTPNFASTKNSANIEAKHHTKPNDGHTNSTGKLAQNTNKPVTASGHFKGIGVPYKKPSKDLTRRDPSDEGISLLQRAPLDTDKYLMDDFDSDLDSDDENNGITPHCLPQTAVIQAFNDRFKNAIAYISKQRVIGVSCEGVNLSRYGKICWLLIGTREFVYLFDVLKLGTSCFDEGLQEILENGNILKVADIIIYKRERQGELPQLVNGLVACLYEYLNMPPENMSFQKYRVNQMQLDEAIWTRRPLPERMLDAAAKRVVYLRELRLAQMERLMAECIHGVNIYLGLYRDSWDQLRGKTAHKTGRQIPKEFRELSKFDHQRRYRRYDHQNFTDDLEKGHGTMNAPDAGDLWKEGQQFADKYHGKHGKFREQIREPVDILTAVLPGHLDNGLTNQQHPFEGVSNQRQQIEGGANQPIPLGEGANQRPPLGEGTNQRQPLREGELANQRQPLKDEINKKEASNESANHMAQEYGGDYQLKASTIKNVVLMGTNVKGSEKNYGPPRNDALVFDDVSGEYYDDFAAFDEEEENENLFQFHLETQPSIQQTTVTGKRPFSEFGAQKAELGRRDENNPRPSGGMASANAAPKPMTMANKFNPNIPGIFNDNEFPPLSSSDNESLYGSSPAPPPRRQQRQLNRDSQSPGLGHGARAQSAMRSTPPLPQQQENSELSVLGRGRALLYQRLATMPRARLPNLDQSPLATFIGATPGAHEFPSDAELMATPAILRVDDPDRVGGTRVRIRKA